MELNNILRHNILVSSKASQLTNQEVENELISILLRQSSLLDTMDPILKPSDFACAFNSDLFKTIQHRYSKGEPDDPCLVWEEFTKSFSATPLRYGPDYDVSTLFGMFRSRIQYDVFLFESNKYAQIVKDLSIRRSYYYFVKDFTTNLLNREISLDNLSTQLNQMSIDLLHEGKELTSVNLQESIINRVQEIKNRTDKDLTQSGIKTGHEALDDIIVGFRKGDFVIIGARPSVGKTAFSMDIAINMNLRYRTRIGFFSLEMNAESLVDRALSRLSYIEHNTIKHEIVNPKLCKRLDVACTLIGDNFWIYDKANMDVDALCAQARRLKKVKGVDIIFIDYIGLIGSNSQKGLPRHEQVSTISRTLKELARSLEIPIIALSQLTRDSQDKDPTLASLRESGALEQDADMVFLMNRDNTEGRDELYAAPSIPIKLKVAKNRNGRTGDINLRFYS